MGLRLKFGLGPGLRLEGRGGARVNLVVHVVQLLISFRWVGGEHADALLALVRVRVRVRVGVRLRVRVRVRVRVRPDARRH